MTLLLVVALALAGGGVHIAYRNPRMGAAILVGLGILTALYLVWEKDPGVLQTGVPPVPAPAATPPAGQLQIPAPAPSSVPSRPTTG